MKKLVIIVFSIIAIAILIGMLCGCGANKMFIKYDVKVPKTFIITRTTYEDNEIQFYYNFDIWDDLNYWKIEIPYNIYLRKDFVTGDTITIKTVLLNSYLIIKK